MARPGVMLYFSILPALDSLDPASVGTLLLAAMHYAQDGREPSFEQGTLAFAWAFLKPTIDRDGEAYVEKRQRGEWLTYCRQCKRDGNEPIDFATWQKRYDTDALHTDTNTEPISESITVPESVSVPESVTNKKIGVGKPPTRPRFVPPTVEEVLEYCEERRNGIDAEHFVDFYTANGWKQGAGKPIKDWRAAVRTWERREPKNGRNEGTKRAGTPDQEISFPGITIL